MAGHRIHNRQKDSSYMQRKQNGQPVRVQKRAPLRKYSEKEIRRNRIIALVILLVFFVLVFSVTSCIARALGEDGSSTSLGMEQSSVSVDVRETSSQMSGIDKIVKRAKEKYSEVAAVAERNTGVEDPWCESGYFTTGDNELDVLVKEFCDSYANASLDPVDNAFEAYKGIAWANYVESDDNQHPVGPDWDIQYAKQWFYKQGGNCYEFAAANEYMFKYFGFADAQAMPVLVKLQSGNYGEHGLTFVTGPEGKKCLCDTSLGINGWLLDANSYTLRALDVGQDISEFKTTDFEEIVKAGWLEE